MVLLCSVLGYVFEGLKWKYNVMILRSSNGAGNPFYHSVSVCSGIGIFSNIMDHIMEDFGWVHLKKSPTHISFSLVSLINKLLGSPVPEKGENMGA